MYQYIYEYFLRSHLSAYASPLAVAILFCAVVALAFVLRLALQGILTLILSKAEKRSRKGLPKAMRNNKIPHRLANLVVPIVVQVSLERAPEIFLQRGVGIITVWVLVLLLNSVIAAISEVYEAQEIAKIRPMKGLFQVIQVALYILLGIAALAIITGQPPLALVGGIGATTAIISFIFKDPILNFVAGIQLSANNMLRIGDWIEMPGHNLDGDVIEISMTTVKVQNFDQTITSIPAQALVSDAFINWRGMQEAGGRRIKRSILINAGSVQLCSSEMLEEFHKIDIIADYMEQKLAEIAQNPAMKENAAEEAAKKSMLNTRHLTNLGTFRAYMAAYLKAHPDIHHDMTTMVRQLEADEKGIPLEVYAFTSTIQWEQYEIIQADIFDHFFSAARVFGLEIHQSPSGADFKNVSSKS